MSKYLSIYNKMKTSPIQLAVCNITGIILTIDIPFIPGKVLEYENPLARIENAKDIALLPYSIQSKISPHILAGSLLTILNHYDLIEDHLSSIERNSLLCNVPVYYLCEAMRFFANNTARRIALFPHLSLSVIGESEKAASTFLTLKTYIEDCSNYLLPSTSVNTIKEETEVKKTIIKDKKDINVSSDIRKQAKLLISDIIESEVLNAKVITLLKIITQGNNLIIMNDLIRDKLISKLDSLECPAAGKLANLLDSIKNDIKDEVEPITTTNFSSKNTKKSLLEILKSKTSKKEEIIEKEFPIDEIIEEIEDEEGDFDANEF